MLDSFEMLPKITDVLSPQAYLSLSEREQANIVETNIIPPKLGSSHFGKIQVVYRLPVYKHYE